MLAKCSVLYLGTAISSPGQRGIDAIQEPLSRRYPVDGKEVVRGIEAWLSIYDNGLQLQFARDPSVVLFYPIRSLVYCASIRFATRTQTGAEFPNGWRFVPLDSPAAARVENTRNPPLFAVTFRRTRHLPVDECHSFVTKTRQAALALVQACFSAYQATVPQQDCSKVPLYFKVDDYGSKNKEIDNEIRIVPAPDRERTLDYQTNTEGGGFYYKTDRVPIDTWQLWEHHKHDNDRSTSKNRSITSRSRSCSSSRTSASSSCTSSSSSCSSCHHSRRSRRSRRRRRRLASMASVNTIQRQQQQQQEQQQQQYQQQQPQSFQAPDSQSLFTNTINTAATTPVPQSAQSNVDPYAPAPNLIRVERIKDVNSGQDVFIRWITKCSVLYLGTAISSPGQRGIDAIQEPLSRRYPVDGKEVVRGIEAWLSIYDNGLQLQFARDPSVVLFYPIRSLVYCASIRFATRTQTGAEFPNGWRFVPLDSPAAARVENTRNPPLFAVTFRRTRHLPVDECHSFVTKTRQAALALVQACFSAYQATVPQQDCSKVPLYFKVDDYGSKNKEIDNEIRIVPAPDRERTLDYQTNTEGGGFYYKTDRVPIDTWQLWEHHKHDNDRSTSKNRSITSRSRSCSSSRTSASSSCTSSSSSCSSCHHSRRSRRSRRRRRRLASMASVNTIQRQQQQQQQQQQQPQSFQAPDSQSLFTNTINTAATTPVPQSAQSNVDPYAPAPNLIRVERIKDVNSGQDVFIRWISETNPSSTVNDEQQNSAPQQAYSTQPPSNSGANYRYQLEQDLPSELEQMALEDEHLRKSLLFDDRSPSISSNYKQKKYKKRGSHRSFDNDKVSYEVVNGFFEDRQGKRRPIKLDRPHMNTMVKDYRHLFNDPVNSSVVPNDRRLIHPATSVVHPSIREQQQQQQQLQPQVQPQQQQPQFPILTFPRTNQQLMRPYGAPFIPRAAPMYPQQSFPTTPLFSQPNFINGSPMAHPPYWYRPM
ncbi:unnamed protein product [Adineta steineri]|uniref:Uncharacterized protein n=2 Tax=Adineta steineri TaxID=433720 RepID=A0A813MHI1_9BILA|nr:unnamed protein product [Adineta steineri]